jgi:hypothetical protein
MEFEVVPKMKVVPYISNYRYTKFSEFLTKEIHRFLFQILKD